MADQSVFPAALDADGDLRSLVPAGTTPASFEDYLQLLGDAVTKIQAALGTNPAGASGTVAERLGTLAAADTVVTKSGGWDLGTQAGEKALAAYAPDDQSTAFSTTLPDPADAPATADALRDDLVTNTLPAIRQALTDLNDLRAAVENLRAAHEDLRAVVAAVVGEIDSGA